MTKDRDKIIIAIDFDGTLCWNRYPKIGRPLNYIVDTLISLKKDSDKYCYILWTCRKDSLLKEAVAWCKEIGLEIDYVNENAPWMIEEFGGDTRKIFAHYYLDDRSLELKNLLGLELKNLL